MGAHRPSADVEDDGDDLVGMALRDHPHNFRFTWTESGTLSLSDRHSNQQISTALDLHIDKDALGSVASVRPRRGGFGRGPERDHFAKQLRHAIAPGLAGPVRT